MMKYIQISMTGIVSSENAGRIENEAMGRQIHEAVKGLFEGHVHGGSLTTTSGGLMNIKNTLKTIHGLNL